MMTEAPARGCLWIKGVAQRQQKTWAEDKLCDEAGNSVGWARPCEKNVKSPEKHPLLLKSARIGC